ncbi:hypothetical protein D3C73_1378230 [compost metagenome]
MQVVHLDPHRRVPVDLVEEHLKLLQVLLLGHRVRERHDHFVADRMVMVQLVVLLDDGCKALGNGFFQQAGGVQPFIGLGLVPLDLLAGVMNAGFEFGVFVPRAVVKVRHVVPRYLEWSRPIL